MNILLVDVERDKHEGFTMFLKTVDVDNGVISYMRNSMRGEKVPQSFRNMSTVLARVIIDRKPDKIIFDNIGIGKGLKDDFMALAEEGWLTFIVDSKGNIVYKGVKE